MSKAHVIGLGKSGVAAARLLRREGWEVELSDRNTSENFLNQQQLLSAEQIQVKLGYSLELYGSDLPDLIAVSPGVPWDVPVLVQAREMSIETIGEMELAWRLLESTPWVAITGTNGKTTTMFNIFTTPSWPNIVVTKKNFIISTTTATTTTTLPPSKNSKYEL